MPADVVWSGEYLDYAEGDSASAVCEGTLQYMDEFTAHVAELFGVQLPRNVLFVLGTDETEAQCGGGDVLGCTRHDTVFSLVAPQEHEIVHAVRSSADFSHFFLEEGYAEAFGDDARLPLRQVAAGSLLDGIASASFEHGLPPEYYPLAGHFAAHLHKEFGAGASRYLLTHTTRRSSSSELESALEAATGDSFMSLQSTYEAVERCDQHRYHLPVYGCLSPHALRPRCDGDRVVLANELIECGADSVIGPRDNEIWKYVALEVPVDGTYGVIAFGDGETDGGSVELHQCSLGCAAVVESFPLADIPAPVGEVWLPAGRYSLRLTRGASNPGPVSVGIFDAGCN